MRDVSEHSDSEFYYRDGLSDKELLQQPTYFDKEEVCNFIRSQHQANNVKKTMYDMNVFQRFLNEWDER